LRNGGKSCCKIRTHFPAESTKDCRKAAGLVEKVLRSAVANAEESKNLDVDTLVIRNIFVDKGPTLKRFRARARGRGSKILKRTSSITVVIAENTV